MYSFSEDIPNLLETFSAYDRCFNVREVVSWGSEGVDAGALKQALQCDDRFFFIGPSAWGMEYYIPRKAAVAWWSGFITRLAAIGESRLHERQLAAAMNTLYRFPLWVKPPQPLMAIGLQSDWVAPAWTPGIYVFPIAHLVHRATPPLFRPNGRMQLALLDQTPEVGTAHIFIGEAVEMLLDTFGDRVRDVVMAREGIPPHGKATLETLGSRFGVTRERIRQIEGKFWRGLRHPRRWGALQVLLQGLIGVAGKPGGLVLSADEDPAPYVRFAAKCLGIPYVHTAHGSLIVLGTKDQGLEAQIERRELALATDDVEQVAALLDSGPLWYLDRTAMLAVAQAIVEENARKLTKQEKVYLTLKQIGSSAHYSKVASEYWQLFPGDDISEHNIHAILSRCASPELELHGIVLVGVKGTYGLKEHGYERPGMKLFDTVSKIVEEKYAISQKPVHINVIVSELGKYRREVNPASLAFATGMNSDIYQIEKDYFLPKGANGVTDSGDIALNIDSILREFRDDHTLGSSK